MPRSAYWLALAAILLAVPPTTACHSAQAEETASASGAALLEQAAWLAGRWIGTGMGGEVEEIWSPAAGGQMVGHMRYFRNGEPGFYEIMMIDRIDAGLRMRVKHFNPDFTAWEDKAEWIAFDPVSISANQIRFKGLVLDHRIEGDREIMTATLRMRQKGGEVSDVVFAFEKVD